MAENKHEKNIICTDPTVLVFVLSKETKPLLGSCQSEVICNMKVGVVILLCSGHGKKNHDDINRKRHQHECCMHYK
jgi:hypothetical protein